MSAQELSVEQVFLAASELPTTERGRYLDEQCAADPTMRAEIESLLRVHDQADGFLETPAPVRLDLLAPAEGAAPDQIGPYEILGPLGVGGMGM
ncbi:MAG TPA: hypothetical protein VFF69_14720, partial [Phycisphaerales bacterium]|nr:hypothetical protein [Phycisphaerales bacterium]